MSKILIVTYHFPPDADVGAIRTAKFTKYLPDFGWQPVILTVKQKYYGSRDESKLQDLKATTNICRTSMLPRPSRLYLKFRALLKSVPYVNLQHAHSRSPQSYSGPLQTPRRLLVTLECLPDDKQVWIPIATLAGLKLIKQEQIPCILTSGPPASCHLIGLLLKKLTAVKWIADFRDPWLNNPLKSPNIITPLSNALDRRLEKAVTTSADKIIAASNRIRDDLIARYAHINSKTEVLLSGYDPADFRSPDTSSTSRDSSAFTMTHTGTLYLNRTAEPFLIALADLIKCGELRKHSIRVNFIGYSHPLRTLLNHLELSEVVAVTDFLPYKTCLRHLCASDLLLLFAQDQPTQIPAKFYDYIGARKPMLIFTNHDGATADLARSLNCGTIIDSSDPSVIRQKLLDVFTQFKTSTLTTSVTEASIAHLAKPTLTHRLAELIDAVVHA